MCLVGHLGQPALLEPVPPVEQHALADQPEPGGVLEGLVLAGLGLDVPEHLPQLAGADPPRVPDLVDVDVQGDVGLDEEDVVDLVLPPLAVRGGEVVDAREEVEALHGDLRRRDPQLVVELADGGPLGPLDVADQVPLARLRGVRQGVGAAGVGPHVWEGDLFRRPLLQQQLLRPRVEHERRKGPVQQAPVDVGHEVAGLLGGRPQDPVVVVQHDAHLVHEPDLLLVVAREQVVVGRRRGRRSERRVGRRVGGHVGTDQSGVDVGEEGGDILAGDVGGGGGGGRRSHFCGCCNKSMNEGCVSVEDA